MKSFEEEHTQFAKTQPQAVKGEHELFLIEVPDDFDVNRLKGHDPTGSKLTELQEDEQAQTALTIREIEGEAYRNLADQLLPIVYEGKRGWQLRKRFKAIYKLTEVHRIPKIKKKAYRKVVPHSIKKQRND